MLGDQVGPLASWSADADARGVEGVLDAEAFQLAVHAVRERVEAMFDVDSLAAGRVGEVLD